MNNAFLAFLWSPFFLLFLINGFFLLSPLEALHIKPTNPVKELARYVLYKRLRRRFQELVLDEGIVSRRGWIRAFERWQLNSKLEDEAAPHDDDDDNNNDRMTTLYDPLFPCTISLMKEEEEEGSSFPPLPFAAETLEKDLLRMNLTAEGATRVRRQISRDSMRAISQISQADKFIAPLNLTSSSNEEEDPLSIYSSADMPLSFTTPTGLLLERRQYTIDFRLISGPERLVFRLNHNYYDLLVHMWTRNRPHLSSSSSSSSFSSFYDDVFSMLVRYESLDGFGWQAAISPIVIAAFVRHFDITCECFASPLNCQLPTYCSIFPDTDAAFGSIGNFFKFFPKEGSFEANPPFVAALMVKMLAHITSLLELSSGPMSFIIIVPAWTEDPHFAALSGSPFRKGLLIIPAAEHCYCDGSRYNRKDDFRPAPFDTAIFLLQNKEGHKLWPLTVDVEADIRAALKQDQPSANWKAQVESEGLYIPKSKRL